MGLLRSLGASIALVPAPVAPKQDKREATPSSKVVVLVSGLADRWLLIWTTRP